MLRDMRHALDDPVAALPGYVAAAKQWMAVSFPKSGTQGFAPETPARVSGSGVYPRIASRCQACCGAG